MSGLCLLGVIALRPWLSWRPGKGLRKWCRRLALPRGGRDGIAIAVWFLWLDASFWYGGGAGNDVVKPQDIADDRLEGNEGSDVLAGSNGDDELCGVNRKGLVGFLSRCENAACVEGRADWWSRGLSEDLLSGSRRDDVRMKTTGRVSS
jgi:hypothetical protein